jgi:hypothetical protein
MNRLLLGLLTIVLAACGDETLGDLPDDDATTSMNDETDTDASSEATDAEPGVVGSRCTSEGTCELGLECFSQFPGERPICTRECMLGECPDETTCIGGVPDYNGNPLSGYCLRVCEANDDCAELGSECDAVDGVQGRYCF